MKNIVVLFNPEKDPQKTVTNKLCKILSDCNVEYTVTDSANSIEDSAHTDLVIVLGGDGSIMRAADVCAPRGIPILGVNLGHIGYIAELETTELDSIQKYFSGEYTVEERMMLSVSVDGGEVFYALNDAVISNGEISKMASLELSCGGTRVSLYRADGLIIATPTGSTAYSMSAGGPIIEPSLNCILATPVCSHSLSSRPIIFSGNSVLSVKNTGRGNVSVYLTLDGEKNVRIPDGGIVTVKKSALTTNLIRLKNDVFYRKLSNKLD